MLLLSLRDEYKIIKNAKSRMFWILKNVKKYFLTMASIVWGRGTTSPNIWTGDTITNLI